MELDDAIKNKGGTVLSLKEGVYTNQQQNNNFSPPEPKWPPDYPNHLWHSGLGQEVKIVGVQDSSGTIQYQIRVINSSDTTTRIAVEGQLQELAEAERVPEDGALPINRAPWAGIKTVMLEFLASYPIDAEKRSLLETQVKSKNKGLASALIDERSADVGFFTGASNLAERMQMRHPGFPWDALAPLFDYSLPVR